MRRHEFLYFSENDIMSLDLGMDEVLELTEKALAEKGRRETENPAKIGVHSKDNAFIHAMPSYLKESNSIGIKWVSGYPSNKELDIPTINGLEVINSTETGLPLAVMNATWITNYRTGAVSAVTAKYLANQSSETLAIIGAGVQGHLNAYFLSKTLVNLKRIKVYDINLNQSEHLKKSLESTEKVRVEIMEEAREAVTDADIVITALTKPQRPIVESGWLKDGVLCMPLENSRAWSNDAPFKVDKFITDDLAQAQLYQQLGAFPEGIPELYAETGEVVAGIKVGRESETEKIMVMNIGVACTDILIGQFIYEQAKAKGIGTRLKL